MLLKAIILSSFLLGSVLGAVPDGIPYLSANITSSSFDSTAVRTSIASWFSTNSVLSSVTASDIVIRDSVAAGSVQMVNFTLSSRYSNVNGITAWNAIDTPMLTTGAVLSSDYTVTSAVAYENAAPIVYVGLAAMTAGYNNSWARGFTLRLTTTPRSGTSVQLTLTPNSSNLELSASTFTITYPSTQATFNMRATAVGVYGFAIVVSGGTDTAARYQVNASLPTWTVGYRLNITITEPAKSLETYENAPSAPYVLAVPSHRLSTFDLVVSVSASPAGITVFPSNVSLTTTGITKQFTVTGAVGVYTLTYTIAEPWLTDSGYVATANSDFYSPTYTSTVVVHPSLNISIASIPRGFMVNPPQGSWGGAYSGPFIVHIEKAPRTFLTLTPQATDVEFSPPSLTFFAGGTTMQSLSARALTTGVKTVSLVRSGSDVAYFADPVPKPWVVTGKNKLCYLQTTSVGCRATRACQWNQQKSVCSNSTLPIYLSRIPELFDQEPSRNITLTLPSAVIGTLTIDLVAASRLSFNPSTLTLTTGQTQANFTITANLGSNDGRIRQYFKLYLSGTDANLFDQLETYADARPRIACTVVPPQRFFVGTESNRFSLTCDTAPEVSVTFTPQPLVGISWIPVGGSAGNGVTMTPGVRSASFFAVSTTSKVGAFLFSLVISGTNAIRYAPIPTVVVTVLPSGEVLTPPTFFLTAFDMSPFFNCDVTVQAPSILEVSIEVQTAAGTPTSDARVMPTVLVYNNTKRNWFRAISNIAGQYRLVFTVSGINQRNYVAPPPLPFEVKERLDGKAFEARTTLGFVPRQRCRVQVGRQSLAFKGQAPIDAENRFCDTLKQPSFDSARTFNCSQHLTEERCRNELETNGHVCVWHNATCMLLPSLQGKLKMVAYGSGYTILLTQAGRVYSIGSTRYGQLGHYSNDLQEVPMPENITAISAGTSHSIALSTQGRLYSWGANHKGQLGQNTRVKQTERVGQVAIPKGENISCISSGTLHSGALALSGAVFMWGSNEYGQLGNEYSYRSIVLGPQAVNREYFEGEAAIAVQCGEFHTMVATTVEAYTFGSNTQGQLGRDGFDEWRPAPPVLWTQNRYNTQPQHRSWITGRDHC